LIASFREKAKSVATIWTVKQLDGHYTWHREVQDAGGATHLIGPGKYFPSIEQTLRDAQENGFIYGDPEHILRYDRS
jgi:hypothetical protein